LPLPGPASSASSRRSKGGSPATRKTGDIFRAIFFPRRRLVLLVGLALLSWFTLPSPWSSSRTTRSRAKIQLARPQDRVPHPSHPSADAAEALIHRRLVAVADLHGDYEHALNVLEMANIIDASDEARLPDGTPRWIAGHDSLVSTGDIVDRGPDTIKLYRMFQSLRRQAAAQDPPGFVVNLLGNHEVMNALKDWRYVTAPDLATFGGPAARRKAMSADGWIGQEWLTHYNITASLDLLPAEFLPDGYVIPRASFVHGGITPEYAAGGDRSRRDGAIERINTIGRNFMRRALSNANPDGHLPPGTTQEEQALYSADGPLWYRGYATDDSDDEVCARAEQASHALGVDFLVMGHTPNFDGFVVRCPQAKILLIDTGISRAYGGEQSALVFDTELQRAPTPDIEQQMGVGHIDPVPDLPEGQRPGQAGTKIKVGQSMEDEVSNIEHAPKTHRWVERRSVTALYYKRVPKVLHMGERDVWL